MITSPFRAGMRHARTATLIALFTLAILTLARSAALAQSAPEAVTAGDLTIEAPWTRATPPGAQVAGGYLRITNRGTSPDRLIGGSFPLAGAVEVHEMRHEGGVMQMRALDKGLDIPAGASVELKPGGYHLMFVQMSGRLIEGAQVQGTLVFEKAGKVEVMFRVESLGARGPSAHGH